MTDIHSVDSTHLQGYLYVTYAELVTELGKPTEGVLDECGKTQAEWIIDTPQGCVTVYDYLRYGVPVEEITDWHLGGHTRSSAKAFAAEHGWTCHD